MNEPMGGFDSVRSEVCETMEENQSNTQTSLSSTARSVIRRQGSKYIDDLVQTMQRGLLSELPPTVVGVVAANESGNSSVAATNLAIRLADHRHRTLLVNCDLMHSDINKRFHCQQQGLMDCIRGFGQVGEFAVNGIVHGLDVIGIGDSLVDSVDLKLADVLDMLDVVKQNYSVAVLNLPTCKSATNWKEWRIQVDGIVLVVESGARKDKLAKLGSEIADSGANLLGTIMTGRQSSLPSWLERFF